MVLSWQNLISGRGNLGQRCGLFAKVVIASFAGYAGYATISAQTASANTTSYPSSDMRPFVIVPGDVTQNNGAQISGTNNSGTANSVSGGMVIFANPSRDSATRSDDYSPITTTDTIKIDSLGRLNSDTFGLDAGYGPDIWRGSRSAYAIPAMQRLSAFGNLELLNRMEKVLLRGKASSPSGKYEGVSWFVARLQRLMNLGDVRSVIELADQSGAHRQDADVAKIYAEALLALGNFEQACELRQQARRPDLKLFFAELNLVCLLHAKQLDAAAMNLDLSSGLMEEDSFFSQLAFAMAVNMPVEEIEMPSQISILQASLLRIVQLDMTSRLASYPMAMSALFASDYGRDVGLQLGAALRATRYGALNISALRNLINMNVDRLGVLEAGSASDTSSDLTGPSRLTKRGAIRLAQGYLRMKKGPNSAGQNVSADVSPDVSPDVSASELANELASYLRLAIDNDIWSVAVRLVAREIALVDPENESDRALFALANLQLGALDRAQALIRAQVLGVNQPRKDLEDILSFWREQGRRFPMYPDNQNSGFLQPEKSFADVAYEALDASNILPSGEAAPSAYDLDLVVDQAQRLSRSGRLGDLVMFMQERLAQKPFSDWRDEDVYAAIEPMAYIGLRGEALALAKEIVLQKALSEQVINNNSAVSSSEEDNSKYNSKYNSTYHVASNISSAR